MQIFYTNTKQPNSVQIKSNESLGGYCSTSLVPSGENGVLFSEISMSDIEKDIKQYVGLMLKNEEENTATGLSIYINKEVNSLCKYRIGFSVPNNEGMIEVIPSSKSKPYYVEFNTADGESDAITLPDMEKDQSLGLWVERSIDQESESIKNRNEPDYLYEHRNDTQPTNEKISIIVKWT